MPKLAEIPFDPVYTKADIAKGFDFLQEQRERLDNKNAASYINAIFCSVHNGKITKQHTDAVCHAGVGAMSGASIIATLTTPPHYCNVSTYSEINPDYPENFDLEATRQFYDWLINKSPFGRFFIETTVDSALKLGFLISTDIPANLMGMLCIMTRHQREKHGKVRGWCTLVNEYGFSPEMAWFWAFNTTFFNAVATKENAMQSSAYSHGAGHDVFYPPSREMVDNWMNDFNAVVLTRNHRQFSSNECKISAMFGPNSTQAPSTNFIKHVKNVIEQLKKGKKLEKTGAPPVKNPFGNYKIAVNNGSNVIISREDFLEYGKEACKEIWTRA